MESLKSSGNTAAYHALFQAEVNLRKALELYKKGSVNKDKMTTKRGILTDRQRIWASRRPNECHIENPVLYKYKKLQETTRYSGSEHTDEIEAVKDLHSDEKEPEIMPTGIVDRIQANRKERHEACLEEMFQELGIINLEIEPRVADASKIVKEFLDEDSQEIEKELKKLQNNSDLTCLNYEDLQTLWQNVTDHSKVRQSWIEQLGITLNEYEDQRSSLIKEIFNAYTSGLLRIAHLMPPDVHRLMEKESLIVNLSLLKNRRSRADLTRRLLTADIERERQQYLYWEERVEQWRELRVKDVIGSFEVFMESPSVADPANVSAVLDAFVAEQRSLNKKRLDLLAKLKDLKPPSSTKMAVQSLHQTFIQMTEQLDKCNAKYRERIRIEQGKVIQICENELERVKTMVLNKGIASKEELDQITTDHLLPLLGERKSCFQHDLDRAEKNIEDATAEQKQSFQVLFSFVQGLAHHWDAHEVGLTEKERALKGKLHKVRKEHDGQNQVREAKLDIVMDRLRQDSSENALANSLKEALMMLEDIKKSYRHFHGLQIKTARDYPDSIAEELQRYENSLLHYLGVSRNQLKGGSAVPVSKSKGNNSDISETLKDSVEKGDEIEKVKKANSMTLQDKVVQTNSGKKFWILRDSPVSAYFKEGNVSDPSLKTNHTFLTENQDADMKIMPYVEGFKIPFEMLLEIRLILREKFLDHLETWKEESIIKAESIVQAKIEEIDNELDLRLHLHEPRPTRAERDVHNIRAAELISHRERITEHCQGVINELHKLKAQFASMVDEQKEEAELFKQSVEGLEHDFGDAAKSHELTSIQDLVGGKLENYMTIVRATIRKFRQELDGRVKEIRESNTRCRKSLRTFSEGGNFSTEEIEEYRKKLEKVANKIDTVEGHMMGDLEGMETKRLEAAQDVAGKLEEKFKYHLFDLTFIEKTTRWLTNVQLKIKSEVAKSNSYAQMIAKAIATFDRRIDAVKVPNMDKEQLTAKDLHETFMPIIDIFHSRVQYLNCGVNDIALINLKTLKTDFQRDLSEVDNREIITTPKRSKRGKRRGRQGSGTNAPSRTKISESGRTESGSGSVLKVRLSLSQNPSVEAPLETEATHPTTSSKKESLVNTKLEGKYDKKYLVFGEDEPVPDNFKGHIQQLLRDCLDGILTTAEFYYRQKGTRQPTRSSAINENFDLCAEAFINRLRSYQVQTDVYLNSCIQEFRAQIKKFESSIVALPSLVINEFYKEFSSKLESHRQSMKESFSKSMEGIERRKREYYTLLRPTLGHPKNKAGREKLCEEEEKRRSEMSELLQQIKAQMKAQEETFANDFVSQMNALVLTMVREFDTVLTIDDIVVGNVKPQRKTQKQIIREQLTQSEGSAEEKSDPLVGPRSWPSLSVDLISQQNEEKNSNQIEEVKSRRCLAVHEAVIKSRNDAFEIYLSEKIKATESFESETEKLTTEELRWKDNWDRSLSKILDLY